MSNVKPVWRMNTGVGVPLDNLEFVLLRTGVITNQPQHLTLSTFDFSHEDKWDDVMAYQTTNTKRAKYRRVLCAFCSVVLLSDGVECSDCKGFGYTWEPIK